MVVVGVNWGSQAHGAGWGAWGAWGHCILTTNLGSHRRLSKGDMAGS